MIFKKLDGGTIGYESHGYVLAWLRITKKIVCQTVLFPIVFCGIIREAKSFLSIATCFVSSHLQSLSGYFSSLGQGRINHQN